MPGGGSSWAVWCIYLPGVFLEMMKTDDGNSFTPMMRRKYLGTSSWKIQYVDDFLEYFVQILFEELG